MTLNRREISGRIAEGKYTLKEFEELYKIMYPVLKTYAIWLLKDADGAESVINDVFLKIWNNNIRPLEVKSYLYRSVKNASLNYLKSRRSVYPDADENEVMEVKDLNPGPLERMQQKELEHMVQQLIDMLPERRRVVVRLSRTEGFSYKEIAGLLDISVRTVEDHLVKGMQFLQEQVSVREDILRY